LVAYATGNNLVAMLENVEADIIREFIPHGNPKAVAQKVKPYIDAGARVYRIHDMSGLGGLKYAARSAQNITKAEDELERLLDR
jgi:alkanesulfonate monooxygenase SsuD/methylene tetrahydromethanopterin reductase-like flavin-dependent oxidoreductase (luciferase family)